MSVLILLSALVTLVAYGYPISRDGGLGLRHGRNEGMINQTKDGKRQMFDSRMQGAKSACVDKAEGDVCAMQGSVGNLTGTCRMREGNLTCSPDFIGRQGPCGSPPLRLEQFGERNGSMMNLTHEEKLESRMQAAKASCENKVEGDVCAIQGPQGKELTGECMAQGNDFMCRLLRKELHGPPSEPVHDHTGVCPNTRMGMD